MSVSDPTDKMDVVNKQYFNANCPTLGDKGLSFSSKRLQAVGDPEHHMDAVNVNYMVRVLCEMYYTLYTKVAQPTDLVFTTTKDDWMRANIVESFFQNFITKARSTS